VFWEAGKYAASRLAHINQQASHIKQWLEKREAGPPLKIGYRTAKWIKVV